MVAMRMLLDIWRNLTSATTNWSFSGSPNGTNLSKSTGVSRSSSSSHLRHRYNRLRSTGPTKSHSQPANLVGAGGPTTLSSSEESLAESLEKERWRQDKSKMKHSKSFPAHVRQGAPNIDKGTCDDRLSSGSNDTKLDHTSKEGTTWPSAKSEVAIVASDFDEADDEDQLTCDVCGRAFATLKRLARHQNLTRHFGCLQCDSIFPSRLGLECHREQMNHYEHAIVGFDEADCEGDSDSFLETDDDENGLGEWTEDGDDEERERLL